MPTPRDKARAQRKAVREAADKIYALIEAAEAHLPEAEREARWERFMAATEPIAERHKKQQRLRRTQASRAASHGQ